MVEGLGLPWLGPKLALTLPLPRLNLSSFLLRLSLETMISLVLPFIRMVALPSLSTLSSRLISSTWRSKGLMKLPVR